MDKLSISSNSSSNSYQINGNIQNGQNITSTLITKRDKTGLGFLIRQRDEMPYFGVWEVIKNGAAECTGKINKGDVILKVDNHDISNVSYEKGLEVLKTIRPGTTVKLTIQTGVDIDNKNKKNYGFMSPLQKFRKKFSNCTTNSTTYNSNLYQINGFAIEENINSIGKRYETIDSPTKSSNIKNKNEKNNDNNMRISNCNGFEIDNNKNLNNIKSVYTDLIKTPEILRKKVNVNQLYNEVTILEINNKHDATDKAISIDPGNKVDLKSKDYNEVRNLDSFNNHIDVANQIKNDNTIENVLEEDLKNISNSHKIYNLMNFQNLNNSDNKMDFYLNSQSNNYFLTTSSTQLNANNKILEKESIIPQQVKENTESLKTDISTSTTSLAIENGNIERKLPNFSNDYKLDQFNRYNLDNNNIMNNTPNTKTNYNNYSNYKNSNIDNNQFDSSPLENLNASKNKIKILQDGDEICINIDDSIEIVTNRKNDRSFISFSPQTSRKTITTKDNNLNEEKKSINQNHLKSNYNSYF